MTIDEMVYDPATQSGSSAVSVVEGLFTFVSGQIAKTDVDASLITTPVATIGIRGTSGGGQAAPEGQPNLISMFPDAGGGSGEIVIKTQGGSQILSTPNQTSHISSGFVPPTKPVVLPAATLSKFYAKAKAVAPKPPAGATDGGGENAENPENQANQTDAAPAGEETPEDGPVEGTADAVAEGILTDAEKAAAEAFDKVLAEGGSIGDAMAAASDAAVETSVRTLLANDPNHFGSPKAIADVVKGIVDKVLVEVRGQIGDPIGAGTGGGAPAPKRPRRPKRFRLRLRRPRLWWSLPAARRRSRWPARRPWASPTPISSTA